MLSSPQSFRSELRQILPLLMIQFIMQPSSILKISLFLFLHIFLVNPTLFSVNLLISHLTSSLLMNSSRYHTIQKFYASIPSPSNTQNINHLTSEIIQYDLDAIKWGSYFFLHISRSHRQFLGCPNNPYPNLLSIHDTYESFLLCPPIT